MAKDLQNSLHWLEDELLEEDALSGQDFDWEDILSEFSDESQPAQSQNRTVDFDRAAFDDEDFNDSTAVLITKKKNKKSAPAPKKGIRGLVILAVLEVIAIVAVLLRWALWFL